VSRKSKCRISWGLVACSYVPSGRGTLSPGIVATQCKQFCTTTLTSFAIVVHARYSFVSPSVASYTLCPAERQCASTHKRSCSSTARAREFIVHCASSSCHQYRLSAAVILDKQSRCFAGLARTPEPRSSAPAESPSLTETLPYRSRAGLCTAGKIGWPSCHALCARCMLSTLLLISS
jgi:hypothetical protein